MISSSTKSVTVKKEEPKVEKKVAPKVAKEPAKQQPLTYTVKKGDTLGSIAGKYGRKITVKDIQKANNLNSDKLSIGQKLKIPR
ncbi:LysM peptidoglycan-binding domain-containing protein [Dysgonomonas sp. GY617]|nr:LysM peptidoglycan-binding domain-containing protein [Dysgonomonas sp. HGC4]MBF0576508.1 LysM peptidoglycan-binding domain-containing protein [Dysgonomonas sp. GY617]